MAAVLTGLGFYQLLNLLKPLRLKQSVAGGILLVLVLGHLLYADKWQLYDSYRSSYFGTTTALAKNLQDTKTIGVIAAGIHPTFADGLYYLTNRDIIYFNPTTVSELTNNGELKKAFAIYEVKTAVGFSKTISADIERLTGAKTIAWDKNN